MEALLRRSWRSEDRQGLSGPLAVAGALAAVVFTTAVGITSSWSTYM